MNKARRLITNWRIILMIIFLIFAFVAIKPQFGQEGLAIRSVSSNSSASEAGIVSPKPTATPTSREVILAIDDVPVTSVDEYAEFISNLQINQSFSIETETGYYRLVAKPDIEVIDLGILEEKVIQEVEEANVSGVLKNVTVNKTITVNKTETRIVGVEDPGLRVYPAPVSNLRKGLDLEGGTRVLLQPEEKLPTEDIGLLIENMKQRLNVFGLSDVIVREANDLAGNQFVLVEIAGANEEDVKDLLARQGKFEAKIGEDTVFRGGSDITYVCRTADCSGIDPRFGCQVSEGGYVCRFQFAISLSPEAAQTHADVTRQLGVTQDPNGGQPYLTEPLVLYLDDKEVDQLQVSADLRGRVVTDISISGSGFGASNEEAIFNTLENMKGLQTVLITGSLPVKLNIVQTNTISPLLGEEFLKNVLFIGFISILVVSIVVFIRYRKFSISIPLLITSLSETALLLGFAALVGWNLDLAGIAGIIIAIGTGVDHQIVIADETLRKESEAAVNWKKQLKNAFFIITCAYLTTVFAMAPLLFAGAGLLKGFALTTMAGITFGILITRPAFAAMVRILNEE